MTSMPTFVEGGELEPIIRRALAWLERNSLGVFWGRLEHEESVLRASWSVDLVADVEAFLALAKDSGSRVVFVDCTPCDIVALLDEAKVAGSPALERLSSALAPRAGQLVEIGLSWVSGTVVHEFAVDASWADDYFAACDLAEGEPDETEEEDGAEEGPDDTEVRRHAEVLARDPKFQVAGSGAQRSYAARRVLDDPIVADKELFEAVILEARNIFEVEIKPDAEKRLVEEVQRLKDQGLTKAQIARRLGISANRMKTMF